MSYVSRDIRRRDNDNRKFVQTLQQHCLLWSYLDMYRHVTVFCWMFTTACCLVVRLGLGLRLVLDFVSGWLVVIHTYLYYFPSGSLCRSGREPTATGSHILSTFSTFPSAFRWLPHSWCFLYFCFTEHLPTLFHTASIWLTVGLAAQRYYYVCLPVSARRLCTTGSVVRLVVVSRTTSAGKFHEFVFGPKTLREIFQKGVWRYPEKKFMNS